MAISMDDNPAYEEIRIPQKNITHHGLLQGRYFNKKVFKWYCIVLTMAVMGAIILTLLVSSSVMFTKISLQAGNEASTCTLNTIEDLEVCVEKAKGDQFYNTTQWLINYLKRKNPSSDLTCISVPNKQVSSTSYGNCADTSTVNVSDGEWVTIAEINMANSMSRCPPNFTHSNMGGLNTCRSTRHTGCSSTFFNTFNMTFSKVYGKLIGYQYLKTNSFLNYNRGNNTIDDPYVDGVSLTYGYPRRHIWTFASDMDQSRSFCPCGTSEEVDIPDFIEEDYFCDSGILLENQDSTCAFSSPLWDGEGCSSNYGCCRHNCPPWFYKELGGGSYSGPIELRVCKDQASTNEDILLRSIELYIHE